MKTEGLIYYLITNHDGDKIKVTSKYDDKFGIVRIDVKLKKVREMKLKIGKATITWREGFLPECNCWMSRIFPFSLTHCWHIRYIAKRREVGDKNFLFKSEGGKL